ncbi:hypothetical protein AB0892_08450 [Streptomyces sp. NPDC005409]
MLNALTTRVRSFGQMLTERQGERLPQWQAKPTILIRVDCAGR